MNAYLALLRGINVSGKNKILMADLKTLFWKLGFGEVQTYIQSGNIIFGSEDKLSNTLTEKLISAGIQTQFHLDVPVIVRSSNEVKLLLHSNPFINNRDVEAGKLYVTFLQNLPGKDLQYSDLQTGFTNDAFIRLGQEVFVYCKGGYGETKLSNFFFEKNLGVLATTRNWNTVLKLSLLSESVEK
jgi:uncharacterized protein (DUF1697 family)